jgi:hypothetical protein
MPDANLDYEDRNELDIEEDNGWDGYVRSTYTGAPNECNIHWPTKLVDGYCPTPDCPWSRARARQEKES